MTELNKEGAPPTDKQCKGYQSCNVDTLRALPGQRSHILAMAHRPPISNESRERGYFRRTTRNGPCQILSRTETQMSGTTYGPGTTKMVLVCGSFLVTNILCGMPLSLAP